MKKVILLSMLALLIVSAIGFAGTHAPIYSWNASSTAWVEVTNTTIAAATGTGTWSTGGLSTSVQVPGIGYFMVLPASPTWFKLPRVTWHLKISQWIYISLQYLDYYIHVDMPGDYTIDSFSLHVKTNGGVFTYFRTGGYFTDENDPNNTIPTWLGYKVDTATGPAVGLPTTGTNNSFWYDMTWINSNVGSPAQQLTVYPGGYWEHTFQGWIGFRVGVEQAKGNYSTFLDIYIQSDP